MLSEGFEPPIPASERLQIHAVYRTTTGIGVGKYIRAKYRREGNSLSKPKSKKQQLQQECKLIDAQSGLTLSDRLFVNCSSV